MGLRAIHRARCQYREPQLAAARTPAAAKPTATTPTAVAPSGRSATTVNEHGKRLDNAERSLRATTSEPDLAPSEPDLPPDFAVTLDPTTDLIDGGRVVVGGAPLRLLRLSGSGQSLVARWQRGAPVGTGKGAGALARRLVSGGLAQPHPPPGRTPMPTTVVVPVRDDAPAVVRLLASVARHDIGVAGVVVVDDGSSDPDALSDACSRLASRLPVRLVRHDSPRGPAQARNTGAGLVETELVAFLDADVEVQANWLALTASHFADPAVGAVAPRVVASSPAHTSASMASVLARYDAARSPLDLGPEPGPVRPGGRVPFVPSAALVVRRRAFVAAGGFDPDLRVGEDVDLVWRLDHAGWSVRYQPDAVVTHDVRPTVGAWVRQRFTYGTSAALLDQRHPGAVAPLRISGLSAATWAAGALGHPVAAGLMAGATAATLASKLGDIEHPLAVSVRLASAGHLHAGSSLADCLRRPWWPMAVAAAVFWPRTRPALAAAAALAPARRWLAAGQPGSLAGFVLLHLADDMAYGAGVWAGCLSRRTIGPLNPELAGRSGTRRLRRRGGGNSSIGRA